MSLLQPYRRFDPSKNFDSIDFLPDRWHQSAEMNDLQSMFAHRLRGLGDALFAEGAIVRDARCFVDAATGAASLEAGAIYIRGAVRAVMPATLNVPIVGRKNIGVYVQEAVITELQDPSLRNPAVGTLGYQQPGAWRTRVRLVWGVEGGATPGDFTPVWEVVDGIVRQRDAAPQLSAITQAITRYDRDSSGGTYVITGFEVSAQPDSVTGEQIYNVASGSARVNGRAIDVPMNRRVEVDTAPDLALIDAEPKVSAGTASQHVSFDRFPVDVASVQVRIIRRRTADVVHGGFVGAADPLPDNAVLVVESVQQGATTYVAATDFTFTANQIDWSPGGAEPAPGTTYQVTYQYKALAVPSNLDAYGYDIAGAVQGTLIESTYNHKLRRIDRLVMDEHGELSLVRGVPDAWSPRPPTLPANILGLASIHQRWNEGRRVELSAVRVVPMNTLVEYDTRLDNVARQLAELRLAVSVAGRYSGIKFGQFADPMQDDALRDVGVAQTAVISQGWLQLPAGVASTPLLPMAAPVGMAHTVSVAMAQGIRTGTLAVNPTPQPATHRPTTLALTPAADLWNAGTIVFKSHVMVSAIDRGEDYIAFADRLVMEAARSELLVQKSAEKPTMRTIVLSLAAAGLKAGEAVSSVAIGGVTVPFSAPAGGTTVAGVDGSVSVLATMPAGIPCGIVAVVLTGAQGSTATATFKGSVTYEAQTIVGLYDSVWGGYAAYRHVKVRIEA